MDRLCAGGPLPAAGGVDRHRLDGVFVLREPVDRQPVNELVAKLVSRPGSTANPNRRYGAGPEQTLDRSSAPRLSPAFEPRLELFLHPRDVLLGLHARQRREQLADPLADEVEVDIDARP